MKLYLEKLKLRLLIALIHIIVVPLVIIEFAIRFLYSIFYPIIWIFIGDHHFFIFENCHSIILFEIYRRNLKSKLDKL